MGVCRGWDRNTERARKKKREAERKDRSWEGEGWGLEPVLRHRKTTASKTGKRDSGSWKCGGHGEVHWRQDGGWKVVWIGSGELDASDKMQRSREFEPKI